MLYFSFPNQLKRKAESSRHIPFTQGLGPAIWALALSGMGWFAVGCSENAQPPAENRIIPSESSASAEAKETPKSAEAQEEPKAESIEAKAEASAPEAKAEVPAPEVKEAAPATPEVKAPKAPHPEATHVIFDTYMDSKGDTWLALHENLKRDKPHLAKLKDGTELKELEGKVGKRKRWSKVEVLSGPHKGMVGYLHAGWIRAVPRVTTGPKTAEKLVALSINVDDGEYEITAQALMKKGFIDSAHGINLINLEPFEPPDTILPPSGKKVCGRALSKLSFMLGEASCQGVYCLVQPGADISERYEFVERNGRLVLDTVIVGMSDFARFPSEYEKSPSDRENHSTYEYLMKSERIIHKHRAKLSKKRCR